MVAAEQNSSAAIRNDKKNITFVDKSIKRLTVLASALPLQRDARTYAKVNEINCEVSEKCLVSLESGKSG